MHTPGPFFLLRKTVRDVDIGDYTIPKDTQVLVNMWTICRDPTLWDSPTLFSPEMSAIDVKGQNFEIAPFGSGRGICPGMQLANRMLLLILASFINSIDWKLTHGIQTQEIDMDDKFGITLLKAQPLRILPVPIKS